MNPNKSHLVRSLFAALLTLALFPISGLAQLDQRNPGNLSEIITQHDRRLSRLEVEVRSLRGSRVQSPASTHADSALPSHDPSTVDYRVQPGESLGKIARRNGIPLSELALMNRITNPDRIEVGQLIQIPNRNQSHQNSPPAHDPRSQNFAHHENSRIPAQPFRGPVALAEQRLVETPHHSEHTVQKGETLFKIASTHGISTSALREANGLFTDRIHIGQRLRIPGSNAGTHGSQFAQTSSPQPSAVITHQVKRQETSASIARRYGITVNDLARANRLDDPNHLFVGQSLQIPSPDSRGSYPLDIGLSQNALDGQTPASPRRSDHFATYRVRKGDTVTAIAREFEVSPRAILDANNLDPNDSIQIGQNINIPVDQFWATLTPPN